MLFTSEFKKCKVERNDQIKLFCPIGGDLSNFTFEWIKHKHNSTDDDDGIPLNVNFSICFEIC